MNHPELAPWTSDTNPESGWLAHYDATLLDTLPTQNPLNTVWGSCEKDALAGEEGAWNMGRNGRCHQS